MTGFNDGNAGDDVANGNNAIMPPEYNNGVPPVPGAVWVNGFTRSDGVLVRGYWRGSNGEVIPTVEYLNGQVVSPPPLKKSRFGVLGEVVKTVADTLTNAVKDATYTPSQPPRSPAPVQPARPLKEEPTLLPGFENDPVAIADARLLGEETLRGIRNNDSSAMTKSPYENWQSYERRLPAINREILRSIFWKDPSRMSQEDRDILMDKRPEKPPRRFCGVLDGGERIYDLGAPLESEELNKHSVTIKDWVRNRDLASGAALDVNKELMPGDYRGIMSVGANNDLYGTGTCIVHVDDDGVMTADIYPDTAGKDIVQMPVHQREDDAEDYGVRLRGLRDALAIKVAKAQADGDGDGASAYTNAVKLMDDRVLEGNGFQTCEDSTKATVRLLYSIDDNVIKEISINKDKKKRAGAYQDAIDMMRSVLPDYIREGSVKDEESDNLRWE